MREIVRYIQQSRKSIGISLGSIVNIGIETNSNIVEEILNDEDMLLYISSNTLSKISFDSLCEVKEKYSYQTEELGDIVIKFFDK